MCACVINVCNKFIYLNIRYANQTINYMKAHYEKKIHCILKKFKYDATQIIYLKRLR